MSYNLHIAKLGQSHVTIYIELYLTRTQVANNLTQGLYKFVIGKLWGCGTEFAPNFSTLHITFTLVIHTWK